MGPLIRWEPTTGTRRFRDEMNRLLEDFFGETGEERLGGEMMRIPTLDVVDHENAILVRADMPGIDRDKIELQATPDTLTLRAQMHEEHEERKENYLRRERRSGSFQRTVPLPVEIKPSEVTANYKDGILEVTLPKSEQAKSQQPVKVNIS